MPKNMYIFPVPRMNFSGYFLKISVLEVKLWVPFLPVYGDIQVFLPTSRVVDMTSLVLLVVFWTNFYILPRKVDTLQCYECSDFPREPDSQVKKSAKKEI